jgi:hypothetical protein
MKPLLLLVVLSGCATSMSSKSVESFTWKRKGPLMLTQKGVNVGLEGISYPNLAEHRELTIKLRWKGGPNDSTIARSTSTVMHVPILPMPAFVVRLKNDSDGTLDFANAEIVLEEKDGAVRKQFASSAQIGPRVESDLIGQYRGIGTSKGLMDQVQTAAATLPWLDKTTKVKPHGEVQAILLFDLDLHNLDEVNAYFRKASGQWTVHMTNVAHPDGPLEIAIPLVREPMPVELECDAVTNFCWLALPDEAPAQQQESEGGGG